MVSEPLRAQWYLSPTKKLGGLNDIYKPRQKYWGAQWYLSPQYFWGPAPPSPPPPPVPKPMCYICKFSAVCFLFYQRHGIINDSQAIPSEHQYRENNTCASEQNEYSLDNFRIYTFQISYLLLSMFELVFTNSVCIIWHYLSVTLLHLYIQCSFPFKYTQRQKKLITSLECHPLKSRASTWILFGHRLGKFILNKHIAKKEKFTLIIEEINAMKLQEVNFQKSSKLLASRAGSSKQTKPGTAFT